MPEVNTKTISIERLKRFLDDLPATSTLFPDMPPGVAWSSSAKSASTDKYNTPVAVTLANGDTRLVCGTSTNGPGGIIYSDDGGVTWNDSDKTTGTWSTPTVYTYSGLTRLVCAGSGGIIYSTDRGATWSASNITSSVPTGITPNVTAFTWNDATRLISTDLIYSDDGGATWNTSSSTGKWYAPTAFTWNGATRLVSGSRVSDVASGIYGGVIYSDDGGATWTKGNIITAMGDANVYEYFSPVAFEYNGAIRLISFCQEYGSSFIYSDNGGATWRTAHVGVRGYYNVPTVFTWNGNVRLIASPINKNFLPNKQVIYSDDGGITWSNTGLPSSRWLPVTVFEYNNATYLITCDGVERDGATNPDMGIKYSSDGGITWNDSNETTIRGAYGATIFAFTFNNDTRLVFNSLSSGIKYSDTSVILDTSDKSDDGKFVTRDFLKDTISDLLTYLNNN